MRDIFPPAAVNGSEMTGISTDRRHDSPPPAREVVAQTSRAWVSELSFELPAPSTLADVTR